jgi:SEC-C motif-containing protein
MKKAKNECPCGSGLLFDECCGKYISGRDNAPTAEALMRSRYSAYAENNTFYILNTWHSSTRPDSLNLNDDAHGKWIGLTIKRTERGGENEQQGIVEFVARYKTNGKAERLHETSHFLKEDGQWFYVDGRLE